MSSIDLSTETTSFILQAGSIAMGILVILGYVFYLGRVEGNKLEFRKTLPHEFKAYLVAIGVLFVCYFFVLFILSFILISSEFPKINILSSNSIFLVAGIAVLLSFTKRMIKLNLLIGALSLGGGILLFVLLYSIEPRSLYIIVPPIFLYRLYWMGKEFGESEFKDANLVDVITDYGKEEKLILYQTTNADYRFRRKDGGGEIIIPRERIVKIVGKKR